MIGRYAVKVGDHWLTDKSGIEYEIATVVLMNAMLEGHQPEIFPVFAEAQEPPRRRNVRISFEISVDADKANSLPGFLGLVGIDGDVEPPEDGLEIAANLLTNELIAVILREWKDRLDALVEESTSEASCEYEVISDTF